MAENIRERLLKVYKLANSGVDGEKTSAQKMLADLLKKYSISIDELSDEKKYEFIIKAKNKGERQIITNTLWYLGVNKNDYEIYYCQDKNYNILKNSEKREFLIYATKAKNIEIQEMIKFHIMEFNKQLKNLIEDFAIAYIHKNNLYGSEELEDSNDLTIDFEHNKRLLYMTEIVDKKTFHKTLKS